MKKRLKYLPLLLVVLSLITIALILINGEEEFLWKAQELNLHMDTPLFFKQQMVVSGGLLTWLGTYFTEFFYHPALGVSLLCGWWALLVLLAAKAFRIPAKWLLLLIIPVALLLLTCVDMGYWIYYLKLRGHFFVATIGLCVVCAVVWLYRCLPVKYHLHTIFIVFSTLVLYPFIGFYALLGTLLMGILIWRYADIERIYRIIGSIVAIISIIVIPLLYYRFVFYQTSSENIYWTALPLFSIVDEHHAYYYIPYYIIVLFFITLAITFKKERSDQIKRLGIWGVCQMGLLVAVCIGLNIFWYKDYNFHKELRMQRCMEQEDWDGILTEATDLQDEPTRAIVLMKNLALFRLGRQGDMMYHYRNGAKPCNTSIPVNMTQVIGRSVYYHYGLSNYCYRWCMEDGVEYGWRAEFLKYMTRCALLNGEYRVARKYIDLLKHTRYHCEWAEQQEAFINNPQALAEDKGYGPIFHLMDYDDKLSEDQSVVEQFLMRHFINSPSADPLYQEQALIAALWSKDIGTFWAIFFQYAQSHQGQHMPKHFQEAAYLYGHLEQNVDISNMPFDADVKQTYEQFKMQAARNSGMSEEQLKDFLYPMFGHTFYYDYYFVRNQKPY